MTWMLPVTDLKQWAYCPRVIFFTYLMPGLRPLTFKMEAGIAAHEREGRRERRRSGRLYGLPEAQRIEDVALQSERLGLSGRMDLVLRLEDRAWPVDYKLSRRIGIAAHFKLQLAAYGLLLEDAWDVTSDQGFLYSIPYRRAEAIRFTPRLRKKVLHVVEAIRSSIDDQRMPPPTSQRGRCVNCEFRRFCNDIF
ncbi:MAG TPA: CRISPR-associated protein Cas4 [Anaerolineae bacterium]|nr:CRISPR-associated protein Cas4 [Anaerolineae bacterium]HIQ12584.1 CRISPR-associated protein Cas4 [Caldilineales bacterium]